MAKNLLKIIMLVCLGLGVFEPTVKAGTKETLSCSDFIYLNPIPCNCKSVNDNLIGKYDPSSQYGLCVNASYAGSVNYELLCDYICKENGQIEYNAGYTIVGSWPTFPSAVKIHKGSKGRSTASSLTGQKSQ